MKLPSVTEILQPYSNYDAVPPEVLAAAAQRGQIIHEVAAGLAEGFFVPYANEFAGYVLSFSRWYEKNVKRVILVEPELIHPTRRYKGHPDLIYEHVENFIAITDYKSPVTEQKTWGAQVMAYLDLARANDIDALKTGSLRLDPKGGIARMNWYEGREMAALVGFYNALEAHKYFKGV